MYTFAQLCKIKFNSLSIYPHRPIFEGRKREKRQRDRVSKQMTHRQRILSGRYVSGDGDPVRAVRERVLPEVEQQEVVIVHEVGDNQGIRPHVH